MGVVTFKLEGTCPEIACKPFLQHIKLQYLEKLCMILIPITLMLHTTYFIVTSPKGLFRNNDYITLFIITN